jgi:hypothetical protein
MTHHNQTKELTTWFLKKTVKTSSGRMVKCWISKIYLETVVAGFEAKPLETATTGFEARPAKPVQVVLRPNHSQTVDLGFEAQPRNPRS